jgi:hypothetical protein
VQKRNRERKEVKRKKKEKKKGVRGDPHIKGCGSQIFKSRFRFTVKRSWNETSEKL